MNWTPLLGPGGLDLRCNLACPCPLLAASASAVGMGATRLRCPSEAHWSADAIERQLAHVDANSVRRAYARRLGRARPHDDLVG